MFPITMNAFGSDRLPRAMHFVLLEAPTALARPRFSRNGNVFDSQKAQKFVTGLSLRQQMGESPLFDGPLEIHITFYFEMPKHISIVKRNILRGKPMKNKPDIDNAIKYILDCSNGILFKDDSTITSIYSKKIYDDTSHIEIILKEIE